jgi:hypothetical protein
MVSSEQDSNGRNGVTSPGLGGADVQTMSMGLTNPSLGMSSPPPTWNPLIGEMIQKIDGRLKVRFFLVTDITSLHFTERVPDGVFFF